MAKPKGKQHKITEYFVQRMLKRMHQLDWSISDLAAQVDTEPSTISRIMHGQKSSNLVPVLREVLRIPEDDLERDYELYAHQLIEILAATMAAAPLRMREYMEDVESLARLYRTAAEVADMRVAAEAHLRAAKGQVTPDVMTEMLANVDAMGRREADLHRAVRKIRQELDVFA